MTPNTCLYLPHLDFIATDFSQTEKNRFFEVISYHPKSGEEPFFLKIQLITTALKTAQEPRSHS